MVKKHYALLLITITTVKCFTALAPMVAYHAPFDSKTKEEKKKFLYHSLFRVPRSMLKSTFMGQHYYYLLNLTLIHTEDSLSRVSALKCYARRSAVS